MYYALVILLILINIYIIVTKVKGRNLSILKYVNIGALLTGIITFISVIIMSNEMNILLIISTIIELITGGLFLYFDKNKSKNNLDIIISSTIISLFAFSSYTIIERVGVNLALGTIIILVSSIMVNFICLLSSIIKNRDKVCITVNEELDYVKEIKFSIKAEIKKGFDYILFVFLYILLVCSRIPLSYVAFIIVIILLILLFFSKRKKIKNEQKKLEKMIHRNNEPGVIYAFQFNNDVFKLHRLFYIIIFFIVTGIIYYVEGESSFIYMTFNISFLYLYMLFMSKLRLINLVYSLDEKIIDTSIYSVVIEDDLTMINKLYDNIAGINIYKLGYKGKNNVLFESNIILYNPNNYVNDIKIFINKNDYNDYIVMIEDLYY